MCTAVKHEMPEQSGCCSASYMKWHNESLCSFSRWVEHAGWRHAGLRWEFTWALRLLTGSDDFIHILSSIEREQVRKTPCVPEKTWALPVLTHCVWLTLICWKWGHSILLLRSVRETHLQLSAAELLAELLATFFIMSQSGQSWERDVTITVWFIAILMWYFWRKSPPQRPIPPRQNMEREPNRVKRKLQRDNKERLSPLLCLVTADYSLVGSFNAWCES